MIFEIIFGLINSQNKKKFLRSRSRRGSLASGLIKWYRSRFQILQFQISRVLTLGGLRSQEIATQFSCLVLLRLNILDGNPPREDDIPFFTILLNLIKILFKWNFRFL